MNITYIDYLKLTRFTTKHCLRITGVVFTTIAAIIFGITASNYADSFPEVIKIFLICFIFGNAFGLFIFFLATLTTYQQVRSVNKLYNSLSDDLKEEYGFDIGWENTNLKYNYPQLIIFSSEADTPYLLFRYIGSKIQLIAVSTISNMYLQQNKFSIDKRYHKQGITLMAWGICKLVNKRKCKDPELVRSYIDEVIQVAHNENLNIQINE